MKVVIEVEPGQVRANGRLIPQKVDGHFTGRLILASAYRAGLDEMSLAVRQECIRSRWKKTGKAVTVDVISYWPGKRGDLDATIKAACDCLTDGGAILDDDQIVELRVTRGVDRARPRIEIELREALE
jgi:Holliday junction resolvase RusA-like endonuclease